MEREKFIFQELSYLLTGIFFEIHNELGRYCREKQYGDLLESKLTQRNIKFNREFRIGNSGNIADFVIDDKIIIELKAKDVVEREDYYQTQRYLQILGMRLALLVNFRNKYLKPTRVVRIDTDVKSKFLK